LSPAAHAQASTGLAEALGVGAQLSGQAGAQVTDAARHAYVSGMSVASLVGATVAVVGSFFVYRNLPATLRPGAQAPVEGNVRSPEPGELEAAGAEG
jgi:hypothetical protein